ncbi:hypothetical protein [Pseudoalteromonas rubra]|uniref:hypothetical protein n=1 Tax=Pseudoalteromonas rubra TaxID=43658 RepID=UPI000B22A2A2|nr:hypothetical protein [Pseudoalteromonas rubra]
MQLSHAFKRMFFKAFNTGGFSISLQVYPTTKKHNQSVAQIFLLDKKSTPIVTDIVGFYSLDQLISNLNNFISSYGPTNASLDAIALRRNNYAIYKFGT